MKSLIFKIIISLGLFILSCTGMGAARFTEPTQAPFWLNIHRNVGFSSGNQIRGSFNLEIIGDSANIDAVQFLVDEQKIAEINQSPFLVKINTGDFPNGTHSLSAVIRLKDGSNYTTAGRNFEFVAPGEELKAIRKIILPLGAGIIAIILIVVFFQVLGLRSRNSENITSQDILRDARHGIGICPRCNSPTPLHWWAINLGFSYKLERCVQCGKWSLMKRLDGEKTRQLLAQAKFSQPSIKENHILTNEEEFARKLEDSKYLDHL